MPTYPDVPTIAWQPHPELHRRELFAGLELNSVLDVGAGHGGVFDSDYWTRHAAVKEACDIHWIRELPRGWKTRLGVDVCKLDEFYPASSFDYVQCTEVLEHVQASRLAIEQLVRVARKAVFITSCDEIAHVGPEQAAIEKINRHQTYLAQPRIADLLELGFDVRVEEDQRRQIIAWLIR